MKSQNNVHKENKPAFAPSLYYAKAGSKLLANQANQSSVKFNKALSFRLSSKPTTSNKNNQISTYTPSKNQGEKYTNEIKISKIEYQVRRHCLKRRQNLTEKHTLTTCTPHRFKFKHNKNDHNRLNSFKTELSEHSGKDSETRNTSNDYEKLEINGIDFDDADKQYNEQNSRLDSSFMYADVEMTDRQTEIVKDEEQVSQKMTSKVYKTLASSLMRIF